jgi:hypothetical protein
MSLHQDRGGMRGRPSESPRAAGEIEGCGLIIAAAEKELPLAEAHLDTVQRIQKEAKLPEKVNVFPAPNEFQPGHGGERRPYNLFFGKRFYDIFKIIGQNVIELGAAWLVGGCNCSVILTKENAIDVTLQNPSTGGLSTCNPQESISFLASTSQAPSSKNDEKGGLYCFS